MSENVPWGEGVVPLNEQVRVARAQRMLNAVIAWARTRGWFSRGEMCRDLRLSHHFADGPRWKAWVREGIFESNGETTRARRYRLVQRPPAEVAPA